MKNYLNNQIQRLQTIFDNNQSLKALFKQEIQDLFLATFELDRHFFVNINDSYYVDLLHVIDANKSEQSNLLLASSLAVNTLNILAQFIMIELMSNPENQDLSDAEHDRLVTRTTTQLCNDLATVYEQV